MAALKFVEGNLTYIITYDVVVSILDKMHISLLSIMKLDVCKELIIHTA